MVTRISSVRARHVTSSGKPVVVASSSHPHEVCTAAHALRSAKVNSFREAKNSSVVSHEELKSKRDALATFCRGDTALDNGSIQNDANLDRRRLDPFLQALYALMKDLQVEVCAHTEYRAQYDPCGPLRLFFQGALRDPSRAIVQNIAEPGFLPQTVLLALCPDSALNFDYNNRCVRPCDCEARECSFPFDGAPSQRVFHYPPILCEDKNEVNANFRALTKKIPKLLDEYLGFGRQSSEKYTKFQMSVASTLQIFDFYYSRFEKYYLECVKIVLHRAYSPLIGIYEIACAADAIQSMQELDLAMLCQNFGVASREIDFGVPVRTEYDPNLIVKAMRVIHINTYKEIRVKAHRLLDALTELHAFFRDLDFKDGLSGKLLPNLGANSSLVDLFLKTQREWDICAIILQQATLDFFSVLVDGWLMQKLNPQFRAKLRAGATQAPGDFFFNADAHQALYVDFPILLLLDELYSSMNNKVCTNFKETFLVSKQSTEAEERLLRVKCEIGKFDERRYQTLFQYALGVATPFDQLSYFENLYAQLKHAATIENAEQWLVMNSILQDICAELDPTVFPKETARDMGTTRIQESQARMRVNLLAARSLKAVQAFDFRSSG